MPMAIPKVGKAREQGAVAEVSLRALVGQGRVVQGNTAVAISLVPRVLRVPDAPLVPVVVVRKALAHKVHKVRRVPPQVASSFLVPSKAVSTINIVSPVKVDQGAPAVRVALRVQADRGVHLNKGAAADQVQVRVSQAAEVSPEPATQPLDRRPKVMIGNHVVPLRMSHDWDLLSRHAEGASLFC